MSDELTRGLDPALGDFPGLFGLQVFVVEDELLVSAMLEDMLAEFGCIVAGVAATVSEALSTVKITGEIDAAILDVNLGGEKIFPVADVLTQRNVPVVFSTGYGAAEVSERYPQSQVLRKPYAADALAKVLTQIVRRPLH
ncbi:MAG TPA: response regulator [Caulobacteraceae bacterium]|jgi:CheY-like chemotaxis protein|nr:response regulator [Caulobacteraceae bacterium]